MSVMASCTVMRWLETWLREEFRYSGDSREESIDRLLRRAYSREYIAIVSWFTHVTGI